MNKEERMHIYNCHTHIFTIDHVPERFLPLRLVRWLAKYKGAEIFARILNGVNPWSNRDFLDRYAAFMRQGAEAKQGCILDSLMDFYPDDTRFVILTMDMEYMNAGDPKEPYTNQLDDLVKLMGRHSGRLYPFVFADPRRPKVLDLVKKYIDKGFKGIKIYPPLGYFPTDDKLKPVYEYAIEHNLPIMTHCSRGGVYTREKRKKLPKTHPITGAELKWKNRKQYTDYFTDPENFELLLKEYPELKICFGHFGGMGELESFRDATGTGNWEASWFNKIKRLLKAYPNTYADVSYTMSDLSLVPLINITLLDPVYEERILFGTDFYMNKIEGNEYKFTIELRNALGEDNFKQIAMVNPTKYL
ncbi:MAG: amidohydrolase family protein [Bacteroidales bacterium]|nr:amidohydrolase family protein [Bacteroidales bacterium]